MKTVSIIAATISGNRGAEAMLTTSIGRIRDKYPDCRFNVYSYYPDDDRVLINDPSITVFSTTPAYLVCILFPMSLLLSVIKLTRIKALQFAIPRSVKGIDESQALIDLAGVSFIDGREKFLPFNILTLAPALLLGTPVIKFSQAMGPFDHQFNRYLAKKVLGRCKQLFARGEKTYNHLLKNDLRNVFPEPVSDAAFLHRQSDTLTQESPEQLERFIGGLPTEKKRVIGICPSSVLAVTMQRRGKDYSQLIARLCNELLSHGYTIVLYPNATRASHGDSLRNNDLPIIKEITDHLANQSSLPKALHAVDFDINTNGIKQIMEHCEIVVVSRFHAMIAALSSQQTVIVFGWSHKYFEVMKSFALEELVYDFSQIDPGKAFLAIKQALENKPDISKKLATGYEEASASSAKQFHYLFSLLDNNAS